MKVGDYVRTDKGTIDKLTKENIMTYEVALMGFGEKPIKASPNIIDLIEVGDYVNGLKVIQMYSPEGEYTLWIKLSDNTFIDNSEEIKSIATREQFKNIEYEVK